MKHLTLIICAAILSTLLLAACKTDSPMMPEVVDCNTLDNIYNGEVSSILNSNCATCHASTSSGSPFVIETYAEYLPYLESGEFEIEVLNDGARMADWGNLTEEEIQILQCWYDAGYPEN